MTDPAWAIVPVKSLADAKQRLARVLPLRARRRLMLTMLQDVLAVLRQVEPLQLVLVVTPDTHAAEVAEDFGARVLHETESRGHSAAAISGFAEARANGAARALTLPADAPLVTAEELRMLLRTGPRPSGSSRRTMPEATVHLRVHRISLKGDSAPPAVIQHGILVTMKHGPFTLRREYALSVAPATSVGAIA